MKPELSEMRRSNESPSEPLLNLSSPRSSDRIDRITVARQSSPVDPDVACRIPGVDDRVGAAGGRCVGGVCHRRTHLMALSASVRPQTKASLVQSLL